MSDQTQGAQTATEPCKAPEETIFRGIACGGFGGEISAVDSKDGKIVRIRPLEYTTEYTMDELKDSLWEITARGKTLKCPTKAAPPYHAMAYKKRVYSKNRVLYPLKRVDWEPGGDPDKINPQNRGKSKFKRISWDEAIEIMESEIKRMYETYGPNSILCLGENGHKESKMLHAGGGIHMQLLGHLQGYTREVRTPDSVEGFYWGAKHVWGTGATFGLGMAAPPPLNQAWGVIQDITENTDLLIFQACDLETTQNYSGQHMSQVIRYWLDIGKKFVVIDPFCNYTAVCHDEMKWIPILPNTDAALDYAIMYVWMTEGLYDVEYVKTHTVGFDKVRAYALGEEDGIPKTPEWAAEITGVKPWTIRALAREWGRQRTSIAHFSAGHNRGPYSHEIGRTEAYKLAMQGLGKPGIQQLHLGCLAPAKQQMQVPGGPSAAPLMINQFRQYVPMDQDIPRTDIAQAILDKEVTWWGSPQIVYVNAADQFVEHHYPAPPEKNGGQVHMLWSEKPCNQCCWNNGFKFQDAMRDPSVEFFVSNHQWLENDSLFCDLILPVTTCLEEDDVVGSSQNVNVDVACIQKKACEPRGESMSDFQIGVRLGEDFGVAESINLGMTDEEWFQYAYDNSQIKEEVSFEQLKEKGFYVPKLAEGWDHEEFPGMRSFYEDPIAHPLDTPTGKIEFYSAALEEHFPGDKERAGIARWVQGGPASEGWTHDETLLGERAKTYPLLMLSNTSHWRLHAQCDDITWFREVETHKIRGKDGYQYEPCWIHPIDAETRGIKHGDIIKVENERGTILCGAYVTERMIPQSIMVSKGAHSDPIAPHLDRGGSSNLISPDAPISSKCHGFVVSGYLVEATKVEDAEMEQWKKDYPYAFERKYDPDTGMTYETWVEE